MRKLQSISLVQWLNVCHAYRRCKSESLVHPLILFSMQKGFWTQYPRATRIYIVQKKNFTHTHRNGERKTILVILFLYVLLLYVQMSSNVKIEKESPPKQLKFNDENFQGRELVPQCAEKRLNEISRCSNSLTAKLIRKDVLLISNEISGWHFR